MGNSMNLLLDDVDFRAENESTTDFCFLEDLMATQPERLAILEEKVNAFEKLKSPVWIVFSAVVVGGVMWLGYITVQLNTLSQRIAHLEGKIGDPLTATIKGLESPTSNTVLAANLDLLSAQISANRASHAKPKPENIKRLASTLSTVAEKHPNLPQAWQAVATLASYSTTEVSASTPRPDCDVAQPVHLIDPSEAPEAVRSLTPLSPLRGFVFRNCTLHMDHLPSGKMGTAKYIENPSGSMLPMRWGDIAIIINCDIVLSDSGIAESSILLFDAVNCRFEYQIKQTPTLRAQQLLLASLKSPTSGEFSLELN
jgi:hypothetical protein